MDKIEIKELVDEYNNPTIVYADGHVNVDDFLHALGDDSYSADDVTHGYAEKQEDPDFEYVIQLLSVETKDSFPVTYIEY